MSRNSEKPTVTVNKFPGLQTKNDAFETAHTGLMRAVNVDITRKQKVKRRKGFTPILPIAGITAAWADLTTMLCVAGTSLIQVDSDMHQVVLRTDLTTTRKLCAKTIRGRTYYSDGVRTGVIYNGESRALGIEHAPKPSLSEFPVGEMVEGRYQVAITYVRDDGLESGCGVASLFILTRNDKGINVSHEASSDPHVVAINIYISRPNGTELYLADTVNNFTGTSAYRAHTNFLDRRIRTQFKVPPPAFDAVEEHDGRLFYGRDNKIVVSDPFAPDHVDDGESFLPFVGNVQTIASGPDTGLFVGTDKATYYIKGSTLATMTLDTVTNYGTVPGSTTYMDGALLGEGEVSGILPVWMSVTGLCVGMPDGDVVNITQRSVDIPKGIRGSSMFRQEDGQNHIISVIQK